MAHDLSRKLDNKENLLKNYITRGDDTKFYFLPIRENHLHLYKDFLKQFSPCYLGIDVISKVFTSKNFIVSTDNVYIIFVPKEELMFCNCVKLYFTQNFIINWDTYDNYKYRLSPRYDNHITINTLTSDEIYFNDFDKFLSESDLFTDIQFIMINPERSETYGRGYYKDKVTTHIHNRTTRGLLTALLYPGTPTEYKDNNYDKEIKMKSQIAKVDLCNYIPLIKDNNTKAKDKQEQKEETSTDTTAEVDCPESDVLGGKK